MLNFAAIFTESWHPGGTPLTVKGFASFLVYSWSGGAEFTRMEESGRFVEEVVLDATVTGPGSGGVPAVTVA